MFGQHDAKKFLENGCSFEFFFVIYFRCRDDWRTGIVFIMKIRLDLKSFFNHMFKIISLN